MIGRIPYGVSCGNEWRFCPGRVEDFMDGKNYSVEVEELPPARRFATAAGTTVHPCRLGLIVEGEMALVFQASMTLNPCSFEALVVGKRHSICGR